MMKSDTKYAQPVDMRVNKFPEEPFEVAKIVDDHQGLHLYGSTKPDLTPTFLLSFDAVHGYRNADEADRAQYWESLGGVLKCGCYQARGSDFLDWAMRQSLDGSLPDGLAHFIVVSANDVLDVLSFEPPSFKLIS